MTKKGVGIFVFVLLLSFIQLANIHALDSDSLQGVQNTLENNTAKLQDVQDTINPDKWQYLGLEWKKILLENAFVSDINAFFTDINFVFVFLFGESYSFSLTLFFIILIWVFFLFRLKGILGMFSPFSKGVSLVISICLTIALAQLGLYREIAKFFIWLMFMPKSWWFQALVLIGIIFAIFIIASVMKYVEKIQKMSKEQFAKEMERTDRSILHTLVGTLAKAWK